LVGLATASVFALAGCVSHVTAVRPLSGEKQAEINSAAAGRTARIKLHGGEDVDGKEVRVASPVVRFQPRDPATPDWRPRWLPEAEASIASVESIAVKSAGKGALQGFGLGALAGTGVTSFLLAMIPLGCERSCGDLVALIDLGGAVAFGLVGALIGAAVGSRTIIDFGDARPTVNEVACAPLLPVVAAKGAAVHEGPDPASPVLATLQDSTPVCAAARNQGFGLLRVKLPDGREGFVRDSNLSW
jgi:hypothetical protein